MPVYPGANVAVGTTIARRPPHGPVLALLTHTVLTSDAWRRIASRTRSSPLHPLPWLGVPARVRLSHVLGIELRRACCRWRVTFPPWPRFRRPPYNAGRPDFPWSGLKPWPFFHGPSHTG